MPPEQQAIDCFVSRVFHGHGCGADGREERDTDDGSLPVRYRLDSDQLLLPHCSRCRVGLDEPARWDAAMRLVRAVVADTLAWIDLTPLARFTCSGCATAWHHLGGPLPYEPVIDPGPSAPDRSWHPCPWCVRDDTAHATAAHGYRSAARQGLDRWERQFDGPSTT